MLRGWSTASMPDMLGAMSDITRSTFSAPTRRRTCARTAASRKSPCTKSTPGMASMGNMSVATMRLLPPTMRAAYWLQPPGAAPKSTRRIPGRSSRSRSWICWSLNTARERHPAAGARFTNSSLACSASQRALLFERLGILGSDYNGAVALCEKQKKHLRRLAHPMSPIVMLGNAGLTEGVINELDRALNDHELVKVAARVGDRVSRDTALGDLALRTSSEIVQRIGHVGVFYRRRAELPKILIPD